MLQSWKRPLKSADPNSDDFISSLFEVELEDELKCLECAEEPPSKQIEKVLRLSCHIDNNNKPIDLLADGLKISMNG